MARCPCCGQPVPARLPRERAAVVRLEHVAGPVIDVYGPPPPGRARGRTVVDRIQQCTRCGRELARGKKALWWRPGEPVIEHGAGRPAPVLSPTVRGNEVPCLPV